MSENNKDTFTLVRLKRRLYNDDKEETGYESYVCWIPTWLALEAKKGKKIKLYFDDLGIWKEGYELYDDRPLTTPIDAEQANKMYTNRKRFKEFEYAGRTSYKD